MAVIEAVATKNGVDPLELDGLLADVIDPCALDSLFAPTSEGERNSVSVEFSCCSRRIEVQADGTVIVQ